MLSRCGKRCGRSCFKSFDVPTTRVTRCSRSSLAILEVVSAVPSFLPSTAVKELGMEEEIDGVESLRSAGATSSGFILQVSSREGLLYNIYFIELSLFYVCQLYKMSSVQDGPKIS